MITLLRTNSTHPDFQLLVKQLDADLAKRDGDEHAFYAQYNKTDHLNEVVIAYMDEQPVACGAFRQLDKHTVEIKRMFTLPDYRGNGIAGQVLTTLEAWAVELGYATANLETGKKQPEAIALYSRLGYAVIPNYGPYVGVENSVCFEKQLVNAEILNQPEPKK